VRVVNVVGCQPDEVLERGVFRFAALELTERLDAKVIGATVYEIGAGQTCWPYHYHHGVEDWLYVVTGTPLLRDPGGERALEPGELVAFSSGPGGAHTVRGPGRVVIFSAGARGRGEALVTLYPDSDRISAAPGVMFRRVTRSKPGATMRARLRRRLASRLTPGPDGRTLNLTTAAAGSPVDEARRAESGVRGAKLGSPLGADTWTATLYELEPGEATAP
jgi:uncharacterized cupin superfamily protein